MTPVLITAGPPHLVGMAGWRDDTAGVVFIGPECPDMDTVFTNAILCSRITVDTVRTGGKAAQTVKSDIVDAFST